MRPSDASHAMAKVRNTDHTRVVVGEYLLAQSPRHAYVRLVRAARPKLAAWHDYLTDHGGDEGRPDIEEEIDSNHLEWTRHQVHRALDIEVARLGGDAKRVLLLGQSQGSCCAIDAALTYVHCIGGVFCSIGQVYKVTPIPDHRKALNIVTFNGAGDRCIAASLALRSYASLIDRGYYNLRMHVQPQLDHCGSTPEEAKLLAEMIVEWKVCAPLLKSKPLGRALGTKPSEGVEKGTAIAQGAAKTRPAAALAGGGGASAAAMSRGDSDVYSGSMVSREVTWQMGKCKCECGRRFASEHAMKAHRRESSKCATNTSNTDGVPAQAP
mmetsp:Transcript_7399/g.19406  ORF Transcript_7399/g.19406 Transcript_7399/m.19406 type:complete len:325 (-) Transcript_7399:144-1118(-)